KSAIRQARMPALPNSPFLPVVLPTAGNSKLPVRFPREGDRTPWRTYWALRTVRPTLMKNPISSYWSLGVVAFLLQVAVQAEVRSVYSLGVSADGIPGQLIRVEDGSFYSVLAAGGRE